MKIQQIDIITLFWCVLTIGTYNVLQLNHPISPIPFIVGIFLGLSGFLYLIPKIDELLPNITVQNNGDDHD